MHIRKIDMAESKRNSTLERYKSGRGSEVAASLTTVSWIFYFFIFFACGGSRPQGEASLL